MVNLKPVLYILYTCVECMYVYSYYLFFFSIKIYIQTILLFYPFNSVVSYYSNNIVLSLEIRKSNTRERYENNIVSKILKYRFEREHEQRSETIFRKNELLYHI